MTFKSPVKYAKYTCLKNLSLKNVLRDISQHTFVCLVINNTSQKTQPFFHEKIINLPKFCSNISFGVGHVEIDGNQLVG